LYWQNETVAIRIKDTGVGIPVKNLKGFSILLIILRLGELTMREGLGLERWQTNNWKWRW